MESSLDSATRSSPNGPATHFTSIASPPQSIMKGSRQASYVSFKEAHNMSSSGPLDMRDVSGGKLGGSPVSPLGVPRGLRQEGTTAYILAPEGDHSGEMPIRRQRTTGIAAPGRALCEENLKALGRISPGQKLVVDPGVYRPSTPILEWEAPKRSANPPKTPVWLLIGVCCALEMVITGVVPKYLDSDQTAIFLAVFIPVSCLVTTFVTYMSVTRHLQDMVDLMRGINAPSDIDRVVERLENGRFSRLREPWFVQVHTIRMFCRILKYHHGVNPVSGELMPGLPASYLRSAHVNIYDTDELGMSESESVALHSCFSGRGDEPSGVLVRKHSGVKRVLRSADPLNDNAAGWDQVMGAPPENKNLIFAILKQIKPGVEMSRIPLPAHILEPRSVLERISDMFTHPDLFGAMASAQSPRDRIVAILRWYLSSFHVKPRGLKKPYNSVLGETFECYFAKGTADEVHFFAEQVGHHPPVSVFTAVHARTGVTITGSYMLKGRLVNPNCASISIDGRLDLVIPINGAGGASNPTALLSSSTTGSSSNVERWSMSFPSIFISSLLTTPRIEAGGQVRIASPSTDLVADLSFERKPFFGGDYDVIKGTVTAGGRPQPVMTIGGKWVGASFVEDSHGARTPLFDTDTATPPLRPLVPDTSLPYPSRVIWEKVTIALRAMRAQEAQDAKNELEGTQREIRRSREARGEEYLPLYFRILNEKKGAGEDQWLYIGPNLVTNCGT